MSVTKAILLTFGLVLVFAIIQLGILLPADYLYSDYPILSRNLQGLSTGLGFLFSYLILFRFFWKQNLKNIRIPDPLKIHFPFLIYIVIIAIGLELFDRLFWDMDKVIAAYSGKQYLADYPGYYEFDAYIIYRIISVILIAPVMEELFFRKFLLGSLLKRYSRLTGLMVSSLCFAFIHIETPDNLIPTFLFGLLSGLVYIKTRRIVYSIIFHFIFNCFWLILLLTGKPYYEWIYSLNFNLIYWMMSLVGGILVIFGTRKMMKAGRA